MPGDHFYCTDFYGELAPSRGYEREGITGYVYKTEQVNTIPIYRWYNPKNGDHFYTADPKGELAPPRYQSEGIEYYMYKGPEPDTTAVYRWYNSGNGDHFYTTDPTGELAPRGGYVAEGILGYLYSTEGSSGTIALYRWFQSGLMSKFTYSASISVDQKKKLQERHTFAYYRAGLTDKLDPTEKSKVRALYHDGISHDVDTNPNANGSAIIGGRQLWVNFNNLFPLGDNEIAQTLLHEMMHCAGYTHPAKSGSPGDNGPYFGSPPLRAELAIAGVQSDESLPTSVEADGVTRTECEVVDADATARVEATASG
jgi:Repeat of unknown function (DUF5648)